MGDNSTRAPDANNGSPDERVIYLTGFGPFGAHIENASEAAVKLVSKSTLASELGVKLVTEILDVDYAKTQILVPQHWDQHKPQLVVHVGVSGQAEHLTLEQNAHNTGYRTLDIKNSSPPQQCCIPGGNTELKTSLPLESICDALNQQSSLRLKSCLSQDPGRYLCSFVYYTSLHRDSKRVVFVHVPPLNVCSADVIAQTLKEAIALLYRALDDSSAAASTAAPGVVGTASEPTSASPTLVSSEDTSGKSLKCAGESSAVKGCAGQSSAVKGCAGQSSAVKRCAGESSAVKGCAGESSAVKGSSGESSVKGSAEKNCTGSSSPLNGDTKEMKKSVAALANGTESLTGLTSTLSKMGIANDQPLENLPKKDAQ